jgi:radical SAM superfamily enzyme YgiQ (UPF0313 family)
MPYAISLVLAYALRNFHGEIDHTLFKSPDDLNAELDKSIPGIVCFSNYIWNSDLSYSIASRIKARNPSAIVIFGGPNYPITEAEQEAFLKKRPAIDFYIYRDGEEAFVRLLEALSEVNNDVGIIKTNNKKIPNCHYIVDGKIVTGPLLPGIHDLDAIPSPYLTGLLDRFFERNLVPLTQTTRGCPFTCTYCQDGDVHSNKVARHSRNYVDEELEYIAQRTRVPDLQWADLNFGMYSQDVETCRTLARLRARYDWPQVVELNGKNQKERILEAARIIDGPQLDGGAVMLTAAVQSTDATVLKAVKRQNIMTEAMIGLATQARNVSENSLSEVILCLPGDSKEAHFNSINDLMDAGINVIRSHQFIMLNGSEAATPAERAHYAMSTRFRVTPRTVASYKLFGEEFAAPEIDEICVGNSTMSFEDYLECRTFNLTVEIFYNYGLFRELMACLRRNNISIPRFIRGIHDHLRTTTNPLSPVYEGFFRETNEIWKTREEVEEFLSQPGVLEQYRTGKLGNNEQLMYRALAIFNHMDDLHAIAYAMARQHLREAGRLEAEIEGYLSELELFSLLRKKNILATEHAEQRAFRFDFRALHDVHYEEWEKFKLDTPKIIEFAHNDKQKKMVQQYIDLYGTENYGLGNILGSQTTVNNFYRNFSFVQ